MVDLKKKTVIETKSKKKQERLRRKIKLIQVKWRKKREDGKYKPNGKR